MTSPAGRSFGTRTKKPAKKRADIDPLTIAYIAIGAKAALDAHRDKVGDEFNLDQFSGESGFIYACVQHAAMVDTIGVDPSGEYVHGVHCYDISEPFGEQLAERLLDGVFEPDVQAIAEGLLAELVVKHGSDA